MLILPETKLCSVEALLCLVHTGSANISLENQVEDVIRLAKALQLPALTRPHDHNVQPATLTQDTDVQQPSWRDDLNTKRRNAMEIRLKKVRDRKRLKMGLPLIEDDDTYPTSTDTPINVEKNDVSIEDSVMESLRKLREKQETDKNKKASIREWDLGKEGVNSDMGSLLFGKQSKNDKPLMTQSEWVDDKRKQRKNEFAPPSIYEKAPRNHVDTRDVNRDKSKSTKVSDGSSPGNVLNSTYNSQNNVQFFLAFELFTLKDYFYIIYFCDSYY